MVTNASEVKDLFVQAEAALKRIETTDTTVIIPTINQLRYAGCHLSRYLEDTSKTVQLGLAANHCKRATYDAYEAGLIYLFLKIDSFEEDFKNVCISNVLQAWVNIKKEIVDIKDKVSLLAKLSQEEGDKEDSFQEDNYKEESAREANCKQFGIFFERLKKIVDTLDIAREELNKAITSDRRRIRQDTNIVLALVVAVLTLIVTIIFGALPYFKKPVTLKDNVSTSVLSPTISSQSKSIDNGHQPQINKLKNRVKVGNSIFQTDPLPKLP